VVEGTKKQKNKLWEAHSLFKIVNYESLRSDINIVHRVYEGKRIALVLDESHNVKNASLQTSAVQSLISSTQQMIAKTIVDLDPTTENPSDLSVNYLVALSGTPVANKPQDVARVVQMTAPGMLGKSYDDFVRRYCYTGGYTGGQVTGYRPGALADIHSQLARISVRALRAEVDMELGKVIEPQRLKMSGEQKKVHDDLRDTLRAELYGWGDEWTAVRINSFLAQVMKLQQVTAGFLYDNNGMPHWIGDTKNPKFKWLDAFIDEYLDDIKKLVIACRFVPVIKRLVNRYQERGCTAIFGEVKGKDRVKAMQEFTTNDDCRIMVLNAATSEGLDLNPCQFMVFITKSFQPKTNWQCEDRITGYNQIGEASIIPLLMEGSIDISLETILARKQQWFDAVMGDKGKTTPRVLEGGLSISRDDLFDLVG
jgi:SNF2 family DNA or RNA helicase